MDYIHVVQKDKQMWQQEMKQTLAIALDSIENRGPFIDLLTDATQVEKHIVTIFKQQSL